MGMEHQTIVVATTGSDGSATGSGSFKSVSGELMGFYLDYSAGQAATSDVTIAHTKPTLGNLLVVSDSATDGWYPVRDTARTGATGAISDPDGFDRIPLCGVVTVAVAQADNTETVTVTMVYLAS